MLPIPLVTGDCLAEGGVILPRCRTPLLTPLGMGCGLLNIWLPGRAPNLGKSNWKLLLVLLMDDPLLLRLGPVYAVNGGEPRDAPEPAPNDKRFLYSRSSTWSLSTCALSRPFSCLSASCVLARSATLVSRSLRCFSLRSRNARCAARFCALRF